LSPPKDIGAALSGVSTQIRAILEACLEGRSLGWRQAVTLGHAKGIDLHALCVTADLMREEQAGDVVTYVINRNINFTNVCIKKCAFCAFSRTLRSEQGYMLDVEEVVRRAVEAQTLGATEVCVQAGLAPNAHGRLYPELCRAIKAEAPDLHLHAFSPEEIKYGAGLARVSIRQYLLELKEAGLDSLPGTSAEILDDAVRQRISPGRISTDEWVEVVRTAHEIGLTTTATMMFGHVETLADRMRHMDLLRSIQRETGGFTEFVPLSFVHTEAPMYNEGTVEGVAPGPTGNEVIRLYAIARLMLGPTFGNIQASWVKEGLRVSQWLLGCGVNDLGGTLINESISTSAGASHGQLMKPSTLRRAIFDAGRVAAQRNTAYELLNVWTQESGPDPLDLVDAGRFGSYDTLVADERFRYRRRR